MSDPVLHDPLCAILEGEACDCDADNPEVQAWMRRRFELAHETRETIDSRAARMWTAPPEKRSYIGHMLLHRFDSQGDRWAGQLVWRLTRFEEDMTPFGHTEYGPEPLSEKTLHNIVEDLLAWGFGPGGEPVAPITKEA